MTTTLETSRDASTDADAVQTSLLTGRRVAGNIGGYLDWRADRDASQAATARDTSTSLGDPVWTWLGFMSIRLTTLIASGDRAVSGLTPKLRDRSLRKALVWPVWKEPLRSLEVEALLSHAAVARAADSGADGDGERRRAATKRRLAALGVHAVFAASRTSKGNNDGAYGPPRRF